MSAQKKVETSLASAIVAVPRSLSAKVVRQIFPIHDQEALKKLQNDWVKQFLKRQPIGKSIFDDIDGVCKFHDSTRVPLTR